jgi:uncharacterized protein
MEDKTRSLFIHSIATELLLVPSSVQAAIQLLEGGNTIPFIARYRKEVTGNLDEVQIKTIQERYTYLRELEERRQIILSSIESQGKLTDDLREKILSCQVKTALEDLYLPYKPKRRTRAMIAREKGLETLADYIFQQPLTPAPELIAQNFIHKEKGVEDIFAALAGARDIVAERVSENASVRAIVREAFASDGIIIAKVRPEKAAEASKFEQYYDFKEPVKTIPSHRYLAIRRGEREEILDFSIEIEAQPVIQQIENILLLNPASPFGEHLK